MQNDSLLKVLGWQPHSSSDDTRTLRHYRQFPDPQLAMRLHRERLEHFELLRKYEGLKDPAIRISHPQWPRLQNLARRIQLMEQIQTERIAPSAASSGSSDAESISSPSIDGLASPSGDAETRPKEQDERPSKRKYIDSEHERHAKSWEQVKGGKDFKFESWLTERKGMFSKTTFTDYLAGRIPGLVSPAKRRLIEEEIRHSVDLLGPTRTNSD